VPVAHPSKTIKVNRARTTFTQGEICINAFCRGAPRLTDVNRPKIPQAGLTELHWIHERCQTLSGSAGLKEKHLLRNINNPDEVVLLFEAKNLHEAQAFARSSDLREAMQKVGVVDKPDIYFPA
jgi:hypothetical protein